MYAIVHRERESEALARGKSTEDVCICGSKVIQALLAVVCLAINDLLELLGGQHLWRIVREPHPGLGRAVELVHLEVVSALSKVPLLSDVESLHELALVVRRDAGRDLCATALNQLSSVADVRRERERAVGVHRVCAVLPNKLCLCAIRAGGIGCEDEQRLFPMAVAGETVGLAADGRHVERLIERVEEVQTGVDLTRSR